MDQEGAKIETMEEIPSLRSVKFGSLAQPLPQLSRSFARPAKLGHIERPSVGVKQPLTTSVARCAWTVDELLPSIPAEYMLERSNVYVNNSSAEQVADRITNTLCSNSITATACDGEKNSLQAESIQGLRFRVNLFASGSDDAVIVEVQRLRGCAVAFRQICKDVCRSAKGLSLGSSKRKFAMPSCVPRATLLEQESRYRGGVESGLNMMQSDRVDSQILGLESLESLSRNEAAIPSLFSKECLVMLMAFSVRSSDFQSYNDSLKRRLALTVLANGLGSCKLIPVELSSEPFITQLRDCLSMANEEPLETSLASKCLQAVETSKQ